MIRVKDFAKCEPSQLNENNERHGINDNNKNVPNPNILPVDIEIISLSSDDDIPPARPPASSSKQSGQQTPVKRKTKRLNNDATTPSKRTPKPPSTYKFHKISEYFPSSKKTECKSNCVVKR